MIDASVTPGCRGRAAHPSALLVPLLWGRYFAVAR